MENRVKAWIDAVLEYRAPNPHEIYLSSRSDIDEIKDMLESAGYVQEAIWRTTPGRLGNKYQKLSSTYVLKSPVKNANGMRIVARLMYSSSYIVNAKVESKY